MTHANAGRQSGWRRAAGGHKLLAPVFRVPGFPAMGLLAGALAAEGLLAVPPAAGAPQTLPPFVNADFIYTLTSEYDYSAGSDAVTDVHAPWQTVSNLHAWVGDTEAVFYGGLIYVVSRLGADHITVLDPRNELTIVRQFSVGAGSNPQQICFVDAHRAFVTRYEFPELWEVDPATGQHTDTIDLGPLADADGIPEMHKMAIHAGKLYVTLQRIDRTTWAPAGMSCLAVIDLADNTLIDIDPAAPGIQGIELAATNPNSGILIDPITGDFLIGQIGFYGVADGGIERIDPDTHESHGLVLTEATLGGDLHTWTTGNGWVGYAVRLTPLWSTDVVAFDLRTGQIGATVAASSEFAYPHVLVDIVHRELVLCDRTYARPGLRIYDTATLQNLTPQPVGVGLYPHWLLAVPGPGSGVAEVPSAPAAGIAVYPRPAPGAMTLRLETPGERPAVFEIFDASGRRVARLDGNAAAGRPDEARWDGRDEAGLPLPAGVYVALARSGGTIRRGSIRLVR
jgi:hypothetical protein